MGIEASSDTFICSGLSVTGFPKTNLVGVPNSTVLTWTVNGLFPVSFVAKNKSTAVKYAPLESSFLPFALGASVILPPTVNDCANGSVYLVIEVLIVLVVFTLVVFAVVFVIVVNLVVKFIVLVVLVIVVWYLSTLPWAR